MSLVFELPSFTSWQDELWDTILDLGTLLHNEPWVLVGEQAVIAQSLAHDHTATRRTDGLEPDPAGRLVTVSSALPKVQLALRYLGFESDGHHPPRSTGIRYRRRSEPLGSDEPFQQWNVYVVGVTELQGGDQALARRVPYQATKGMRSPWVPVPDLLSTIVYEASQYVMDPDGATAHARDVAYLVSLVENPAHQAGRLTPVDRRALKAMDAAVGAPGHPIWNAAPPERAAHGRWRTLLAG